MPAALGKILVIRGGAIGDFILTLPVLAAIRERFPNIRLELLAYPRVTQLALASGLADGARSIEARPMASFFAKGGPLPQELADYFASFAVIICFLFDPDHIFQENLARCSKAQFLAGPHRPDERGTLHATDAFLQPLIRLAIFDADPTPRLYPFAAPAVDRVDLRKPPPVQHLGTSEAKAEDAWLALHPGSGSERKNWPEPKWKELLRRLSTETNLGFVLVGGEAEGERLTRLAGAIPIERRRIAQSLPLDQLAALLQRCSGYIGHDSGISHMAAAVGLPGLVLWGETRQEIWRPRSERVRLLAGRAGLSALDVNDVVEAFHEHFQTGSAKEGGKPQ